MPLWTTRLKDLPALAQCNFSYLRETEKITFSEALNYYDTFRKYIQHEDGLINSRLTWSLTIHGFLFAMYGLVVGKVADEFLEIIKSDGHSFSLAIWGIRGLLLLQIPIALFGATVGYLSREAIVSAHNAIQHLCVIEGFSAKQQSKDRTFSVQAEIQENHAGAQSIQLPDNIADSVQKRIRPGIRMLVDSRLTAPSTGYNNRPEEVTILEADDKSFSAVFAGPHGGWIEFKILDSILLPALTGGGDEGRHTHGARSYYLLLPAIAAGLWVILFCISLGLLGGTFVWHMAPRTAPPYSLFY